MFSHSILEVTYLLAISTSQYLEVERKEELEKTKKVERTATAWGCLEISNTRPMTAQILSIPQIPFQLTCDQEQALKAILEFLDSDQSLFLLGGYAGTGKTTLISLLVKALVSVGKRIALTAPTNKAVNVLQRMAAQNSLAGVDFFTIHQLLGLGMVTRAGEKVLERTSSSYAHAFHIVFIDECSMIGEQLWHWIEDAASLYAPRLKIVLMGDPAQLNPVNEKKSPSFSVTNRAVLKQVVRQGADSPLLEFVTACRQAVTKSRQPFKPCPKYSQDKQNGVFVVRQQTLLNYACKKMKSEFDNNPDCFRILCWTNKQVDWYNQHIRTHLYGINAARFVIGERLIACDPIVAPDGKTVILPTSSEFIVTDYCEDRYAGYKVWRAIATTDNDIKRQIYVLHEDERQRFDAEAQQLMQSAKNNPFFWQKYYKHLETFANVRPCFALTVHNSQGSTFDEVAIDANDLNKRGLDGKLSSVRELNRLWYVGSTRARKRVFIVK